MNFEGDVGAQHAQNEKSEEGAAAFTNSHPDILDIIISVRVKWEITEYFKIDFNLIYA